MADVVNNGAINKTTWGVEADKLNVKFNSIDAGMLNANANIATVNGRLDSVDSDLTTINGRLDGVDSDLTTLTRTQAILLLKQQDISLIFKGFAKPGDAVPAATLNHAYIVTNTGTVFGLAATEGQVLVGNGTGFEVKAEMSINKINEKFTEEILMNERYSFSNPIYNNDNAIVTADVEWSDGKLGVLTSKTWDSKNKMFRGYEVTYADTLKVVQPDVTIENFSIINKPNKQIIKL